MAISIAGRNVKVGSPLYHVGYRAWGSVVRYDTNSAVLRITGSNGDTRDLFVTQGGFVGPTRQVYWHEPLLLDLPRQDISALRRIVTAVAQELY